jgi:tetratricopeptide (TPR) repeat protein
MVSKAAVIRRLGVAAAFCCAAACGPKKVAVDPSIAARATLEQADANLRAGCFDCLADALKRYESVRKVPAVAEIATRGATYASALLAMRERELGTTDSNYLERARELASTSLPLQTEVSALLDVADVLPWRGGAGRSNRPGLALTAYQDRERRIAELRTTATRDVFSAYVWLAYACESGALRTISKAEIERAIPQFADAPLFAYALAGLCGVGRPPAFGDIVTKEPRYKELAFQLGLEASGARKLDDAEARYREAYAWRATWPSDTLALANVLITAEDFDGALDFYDRTLALVPMFPDALLGKVRTLTYLSKPEDAIRVADELLAIERYPGDADYWKAYNELDLKRFDDAWRDIEAADKLLVNADVPKLAGIIAIDRHELDVARGKLERATKRGPNDCQTQYFLHLVLTEQRLWERAFTVARNGSTCLDGEIAQTRDEIARIQASDFSEAKKARQIAGRERRIATDTRMRATCWYDAAAASFNLAKKDDAKEFAERLVDDEQLGERARQLLDRLNQR